MQIKLKNQDYDVELIKHSTLGGKQYPIYKLVGPKATYYTMPYLNHHGKHFILDSKCKVSAYMKEYTICVNESGEIKVI